MQYAPVQALGSYIRFRKMTIESVITTNPLPALALITVQFTLLPFFLSMWLHNRSLTGWAVSTVVCQTWQWAVRYGAGLDNVLNSYSGTDLTQALYLFNVVFPWLIPSSAICGTIVSALVGLPYLMPLEAIVPTSPADAMDSGDDQATAASLRQDAAIQPDSLTAFGFSHVPRPYIDIVVNLALFTLGVVAPFVIFEQLFATNNSAALWVAVALILLAFILAWPFWHFIGSLFITGPTERNVRKRQEALLVASKMDPNFNQRQQTQEPDLSDQTTRDRVFSRTAFRVGKAVLFMGLTQFFFFVLWCGIATYEQPSANVNVTWIGTLASVLGFTLVVVLITTIYTVAMRARASHQKQQSYIASSQGNNGNQQYGGGGGGNNQDQDQDDDDGGGDVNLDFDSRKRQIATQKPPMSMGLLTGRNTRVNGQRVR